MKKFFRILLKVMLALLITVALYVAYGIYFTYRLNEDQAKTVEDIGADFSQTSKLVREPNGYFGVAAVVNGQFVDTLILDTQASTSLARQEWLDKNLANYWRRKPIPTFNFYHQIYFSKLYRIDTIKLGDCILAGVVFTSVAADNGMYNALYRPVLGRTVMENLGWMVDMDRDELTIFSLKDPDLLRQKATGFVRIEGGVNRLPLYSPQTDSMTLLFDLGANYDIIIDKTVYEKLLRKQKPRKYLNIRREGLTDTVAEFSGITMYCRGVRIPDCTLTYMPSVNKNIAGNIFAGKMNFIIAGEDLYVGQRQAAVASIQDGMSSLGLRLGVRGDAVCVTAVELNGVAENAGIVIGDKVSTVDNVAVSPDIISVLNGGLEQYVQQADTLTLVIDRGGTAKVFRLRCRRD